MAKPTFGAGMGSVGNRDVNALKKAVAKSMEKANPHRNIHKQFIKKNEMNKEYSQDNIERTKNNILLVGLLHNLVVVDEGDGTYRLVSGERRIRAIESMTEDEYESLFSAGIPCYVLDKDTDVVDEELALLIANNDVRDSNENKLYEVERMEQLLQKKIERGEKVRIAGEIAKSLGINERQVRRYQKAAKLIPELKEKLEIGNINLMDAEKMASLSEESQKQIYKLMESTGEVSASEIAHLREREKELEEISSRLQDKEKELAQKNRVVAGLQKDLEKLKKTVAATDVANTGDKEHQEGDIREQNEQLKKEIERAESEKKKLRTEIEHMKAEAEEKQKRALDVSDAEFKRAKDISLLEQTLDTFDSSIKTLQLKKKYFAEDEELANHLAIIIDRLQHIVG